MPSGASEFLKNLDCQADRLNMVIVIENIFQNIAIGMFNQLYLACHTVVDLKI